MDKEEYWDIYNRKKELTGRRMRRNDWHMQPGDYHLTVLGVIRRTDGRYLITRRVMTKSWAPGWWEVSGGGVMAGESSYAAVLREVREEWDWMCRNLRAATFFPTGGITRRKGITISWISTGLPGIFARRICICRRRKPTGGSLRLPTRSGLLPPKGFFYIMTV